MQLLMLCVTECFYTLPQIQIHDKPTTMTGLAVTAKRPQSQWLINAAAEIVLQSVFLPYPRIQTHVKQMTLTAFIQIPCYASHQVTSVKMEDCQAARTTLY